MDEIVETRISLPDTVLDRLRVAVYAADGAWEDYRRAPQGEPGSPQTERIDRLVDFRRAVWDVRGAAAQLFGLNVRDGWLHVGENSADIRDLIDGLHSNNLDARSRRLLASALEDMR